MPRMKPILRPDAADDIPRPPSKDVERDVCVRCIDSYDLSPEASWPTATEFPELGRFQGHDHPYLIEHVSHVPYDDVEIDCAVCGERLDGNDDTWIEPVELLQIPREPVEA